MQQLPLSNFRTFYHSKKKISTNAVTHCSLYPYFLTADLLPVSVNLLILYKWNRTMCGLLYLAPFTKHNVLKFILVITCIEMYSFLRLNNMHCMDGPHFVCPCIS